MNVIASCGWAHVHKRAISVVVPSKRTVPAVVWQQLFSSSYSQTQATVQDQTATAVVNVTKQDVQKEEVKRRRLSEVS
jgi:hypothetical protein